MQEDTPEATPSNSHGPVESNRNEDGDIGVGMDMEPTETPSTDVGETQASDSTPPQNIAAPSADAPIETVVESSGEPFGLSDPPFVPFVYDDTSPEGTTDTLPEPRSASSQPQGRSTR